MLHCLDKSVPHTNLNFYANDDELCWHHNIRQSAFKTLQAAYKAVQSNLCDLKPLFYDHPIQSTVMFFSNTKPKSKPQLSISR